MTAPDPAETGNLSDAISSLLPALDDFIAFEGPDRAVPRSAWLDSVDEPLPVEGAGPDAVLALLRDIVIGRGLRIGHPGFFGWVTTMPTTVGTAADLAQTVASPQRWWVQPGNHIDAMAVAWMAQLLGFPESHVGQFTSGGSTANLVGLGAARQHAGERLGIDPARDGVAGIPEPRVYASEHTHHVVGRALGVLGMGRAHVRFVPVDANHRLDVTALGAAISEDVTAGRTPVAIVGNAGDVDLGMIDPLPAMAEVAAEHDVWFHVDGAYGGFGILDDRVRDRYGDPASYDSFAVDPHKWMAAPLGTGLVLCRDGALLGRSFTVETGGYDREREVEAPDATDPASPWESLGRGTPDWGVDFSTPPRGIAVWAILKEIGASGMQERVTRHLDCARLVADQVAAADDLELLSEPELSICCFRYAPPGLSDRSRLNEINAAILGELRERGESVPSGTWIGSDFAIRPCFINPRAGLDDARRLVDRVRAAGRAIFDTA